MNVEGKVDAINRNSMDEAQHAVVQNNRQRYVQEARQHFENEFATETKGGVRATEAKPGSNSVKEWGGGATSMGHQMSMQRRSTVSPMELHLKSKCDSNGHALNNGRNTEPHILRSRMVAI